MIIIGATQDDERDWFFRLRIFCDCEPRCDEPETIVSMPLDDFRALAQRAVVAVGYVDSRIAQAEHDEGILSAMEDEL